ncbi:hypothetical protein [Gilvimarinus chinensis]|uniref:hypothetical protein n=1 Tax=Gilvimarinus chinensis TaxID=396005 RepID=UPI00037830FC|nr:hypothetical protein [Gilvimarinus chinensis]
MERHLLWIALTLAANASADHNYQYACQLDGETRVIEVAYLLPDQAVPCEVRYQKNGEQAEVLWRADNQEGFCEGKAKQMVKEHGQWGFECDTSQEPEGSVSMSLY